VSCRLRYHCGINHKSNLSCSYHCNKRFMFRKIYIKTKFVILLEFIKLLIHVILFLNVSVFFFLLQTALHSDLFAWKDISHQEHVSYWIPTWQLTRIVSKNAWIHIVVVLSHLTVPIYVHCIAVLLHPMTG